MTLAGLIPPLYSLIAAVQHLCSSTSLFWFEVAVGNTLLPDRTRRHGERLLKELLYIQEQQLQLGWMDIVAQVWTAAIINIRGVEWNN